MTEKEKAKEKAKENVKQFLMLLLKTIIEVRCDSEPIKLIYNDVIITVERNPENEK